MSTPRGRTQAFGDTPYSEAERTAAVAKASRWTARQAIRLCTSPEEILAAVRRGWLPELLEQATSRYQLENNPPLCDEIHRTIEIIRQAPILPVRHVHRRHAGSVNNRAA